MWFEGKDILTASIINLHKIWFYYQIYISVIVLIYNYQHFFVLFNLKKKYGIYFEL